VGSFRDILNNEIGGDWGEDNSFEGSVPAISLRGTDLEKLKSFGYAPEAPLRWVNRSSLKKREITVVGGFLDQEGISDCHLRQQRLPLKLQAAG